MNPVTPPKMNKTADSTSKGPTGKGGPVNPRSGQAKGVPSKSPETALGLNNYSPMTMK